MEAETDDEAGGEPLGGSSPVGAAPGGEPAGPADDFSEAIDPSGKRPPKKAPQTKPQIFTEDTSKIGKEGTNVNGWHWQLADVTELLRIKTEAMILPFEPRMLHLNPSRLSPIKITGDSPKQGSRRL